MTAKITVNSESPKSDRPDKDAVYIDVDDDITAIIGKVESAKSDSVALVLPKRTTALQSIVNMRLLKRAAGKADKKVVLVTSESAITPLAGVAGILVAKNLQSKPAIPIVAGPAASKPSEAEAAEPDDDYDGDDIDPKNAKLDYHRSIGELAAVAAVAGDDEAIALDDEEDGAKDSEQPKQSKETKSKVPAAAKSNKVKVPNFERFRLMLGLGSVFIVGVIVFIILAIFVLPKAIVTVQTTSIPVAVNMNLDASDKYKALNVAASQIPASSQTTKQTSSQQVPATGQQNNGNKANGSVTLSDKECSSLVLPSSVPAGTGIFTGGLAYVTQQTTKFSNSGVNSGGCITYPATSSTPIVAQSGGAKYNVSSATFTLTSSGYPNVTGTGSASGGTDNIVTVVSQNDLDTASQKVTSAQTDAFTKQWEQTLANQGYYILPSTLKLSDPVTTSTPSVGQAASTVNVTITITYTVMAVKKADLQTAISDAFTKQIDKTKQKLNNDDVIKGATITVQNQTSPSAATLAITEDGSAVPIIDVAQVKKLSVGQKSGDIKTALANWPGVKEVDVKMSPFWVSKAPKNVSKVTVIVEPAKGK